MSKKPIDNSPDVVLLCGSERISCHKAVLSKESHYFDAMFNSGFAESDEYYITIKVTKAHNHQLINNEQLNLAI